VRAVASRMAIAEQMGNTTIYLGGVQDVVSAAVDQSIAAILPTTYELWGANITQAQKVTGKVLKVVAWGTSDIRGNTPASDFHVSLDLEGTVVLELTCAGTTGTRTFVDWYIEGYFIYQGADAWECKGVGNYYRDTAGSYTELPALTVAYTKHTNSTIASSGVVRVLVKCWQTVGPTAPVSSVKLRGLTLTMEGN